MPGHAAFFKPTPLFALHILLFCLHTIFSTSVHAQSYQAVVTYAPGSAFTEGQAFYILGGVTQSLATTPQAFMIDLSVSWNATSPTAKKLSDGPNGAYMPSVIPITNSLLVMSNRTAYNYQSTIASLYQYFSNPNLNAVIGLGAAVDPDTGNIYIPNGYVEANGTASLLRTNILTNSNAFDRLSMLPSLSSSVRYSVAWSASRQSLIMFGGTVDGLYAFSSTNGWSNLSQVVKGDIPSPRTFACLVSNSGGSTMVLFGGYSTNGSTLNDIYVLDVVNLQWTRGRDIDTPNGRGRAACAVSNSYFIAWGGAVGSGLLPENTTVVYNLLSGAWTAKYDLQAIQGTSVSMTVTSTANSTPSSTKTSDSSASNTVSPNSTSKTAGNSTVMIAVGAALAGLVALLSIGGIFLYRARRNRGKQSQLSSTTSTSSGESSSEVTDSKTNAFEPSKNPPRNPAFGRPPSATNSYWDTDADSRTRTLRNPAVIVGGEEYSYVVDASVLPSSGAGRPQKGIYGAQRFSQHPHANVEEFLQQNQQQRLVSESSPYRVRPRSQHPHAIIDSPMMDENFLDGYIEPRTQSRSSRARIERS